MEPLSEAGKGNKTELVVNVAAKGQIYQNKQICRNILFMTTYNEIQAKDTVYNIQITIYVFRTFLSMEESSMKRIKEPSSSKLLCTVSFHNRLTTRDGGPMTLLL